MSKHPRIYGVVELGAAVGVSSGTISVWLHRGSYGIPEPDVRLACGPVWFASTVKAWVRSEKAT